MTPSKLVALMPVIVVGASAVAALMIATFARRHAPVVAVTIAGLAAAMVLLPPVSGDVRRVTPLFTMDAYAVVYSVLVLGAAIVTTALGAGYFARRLRARREEFYVALLLATLGALVLAASDHFASLFLGLETMSVALYAMVAYLRNEEGSLEAGIKYLVLAGASSAFLLFGMALVYLEMGTLAFPAMAPLPDDAGAGVSVAGVALMTVGIGFKLAVVPFHMWTSDVYDGAPAPVTGFLATVSKAAVFAVVLRMASALPPAVWDPVVPAFVVIAAASMVVGNLLALLQKFVKRILAYSSIAHMGYLLVAFVAGGVDGAAAATFYLFAYAVTTLAAFGAVSALTGTDGEPETLDDYRGLFWRRPAPSAVLAVALFSLAGIPLTAGFLGKFYVISAGVGASLWLLLGFLAVNSAVGIYYYLRVVVAMFTAPVPDVEPSPGATSTSGVTALALLVLVGLLVWIGVYPAPLVDWVETGIAILG